MKTIDFVHTVLSDHQFYQQALGLDQKGDLCVKVENEIFGTRKKRKVAKSYRNLNLLSLMITKAAIRIMNP